MSQQLSDRIRFNSPPQSPRALSPSTCNPLSTNSLSDAFSSSSSTLSAGRSSNTSSTYAVSPSPQPFSSRSTSPAPGLRRSPRRSPPLSNLQVAEPGEQFNGSATDSIKDWNTPVAPLTQIVLEEQPLDDVRLRRSAKRTGSSEDDGAFEFMEDDEGTRPRKKALSVAPKRHPCTVPGCSESFTRPNDVLRHVKNAAVHKGSSQQAEALAASSTLCKYCGEELSRPDAARRHELKASCGKRTIRRKSTYSMLPA
ncbi:hypothetical protein C8R47DRAFT_371150 [Mycena vitilis]|nr:hypothetical protein C8R47DRAFT_371150 [Mycena vitilis]